MMLASMTCYKISLHHFFFFFFSSVVKYSLTGIHKWRDLVSSGRLVCRCHVIFLWRCDCFVCFVFVFVLSQKRGPSFNRFSFFDMQASQKPDVVLPFHLFGDKPVFFVPLPFSLCMESTSHVSPFRVVFFYLGTTG